MLADQLPNYHFSLSVNMIIIIIIKGIYYFLIVPLKNEEFQSQENIIDYLKQTLKLEPYVQAPTQNEEIK